MATDFGFKITNMPNAMLTGQPGGASTNKSRRFISIRSAIRPSGGMVYLAVADDGTAWTSLTDGGWHQIPSLPDRED
jgi:hypothetical protein